MKKKKKTKNVMECSVLSVYLPIVKSSDEVASFEGVFGLVDVLLGSADFALSRCLTFLRRTSRNPVASRLS